jgi:hypothetical protein
MLSSVYQQGSGASPLAIKTDPENRLLACMSRRRLDLEALRDALLFVSGQLDVRQGGPAVEMFEAKPSNRRTVYGFIDRQNLPGMLRIFDFANPDSSNPQRYETTVPQQALFLMNNPFVLDQVRHLFKRPELAGLPDPAPKMTVLHRLIYGRHPDAEELRLGLEFIRSAAISTANGLTPWEQYAQVLLLANEFAFVD